jgi:amino acid adenylation domain-containing protein
MQAARTSARIFERFLAMTKQRPRAVAIVHEDGIWSYEQLERGSRALAVELLSRPASSNVVALAGERAPELVLGMLACLRAGLPFTVLDGGYPAGRLEQLLAVAAPGRLVTFTQQTNKALDALASSSKDSPSLDARPLFFKFDHDAVAAFLENDAPQQPGLDDVQAASSAYLLFTSGTTGTPKCITTSHEPLVHFVEWYGNSFPVAPSSRFSMLSGLGHDPLLRDIFMPLSFGAELHIPTSAILKNPVQLYQWLCDSEITHTHLTPQMGRLICGGRREHKLLLSLQFVFSGGDILRHKLVTELRAAAPSAHVVNFYGSSETPQAMGFHVFDPSTDATTEAIPIGRGIDDAQLLVLDTSLRLAEIGERGQIAIRSKFLSNGYLGDSRLTSARFVHNPGNLDAYDLLYLTGDIGHFRTDGAVVLDGRSDDQVKVRGYRVELNEIVEHLERIPRVSAAVVLSEQSPDGEIRLIAYVVDTREIPSDPAEAAHVLKAELALTLPYYMVPFSILMLESIPLLPNNKVDRDRLRMLHSDGDSGDNRHNRDTTRIFPTQAVNLTESRIVSDWQTLLGLRAVHSSSTFLELGGDSLSTISAAMQLEEHLGALPDGWEKLSIHQLAELKKDVRRKFTVIETTVLTRAISIIAIVAAHFEFPNLAGSVRTLFVVSGMSFGRYLMSSVLSTNRLDAIFKLVLKIAIPTVLYTEFLNLTLLHDFKWPALLLLNNFIHPEFPEGGYSFWFVIVLVQCQLLLAALFSVKRMRELARAKSFECAWCGCLIMAGIAAIANFTHLTGSHPTNEQTPIAYLGAIFLGWTAIQADTARRRLMVLVAAGLTFIEPFLRAFPREIVALPFVATFCLVYWRRVSLPVRLGKAVNLIAGASLFTYLTDKQIKKLAERTLLVEYPAITVALAVVFGIIAWKCWETALAYVNRLYRQYRQTITSEIIEDATISRLET